jgi:iron complex transport system permease protein
MCRVYSREGEPAIRIVLDITRLVEEGKLTADEAARLQALAKRDTGWLAINVLMSFGAVAVAAGIIGLEPAFTTGAALGVALVAIGLAVSFLAADQWGLLGTATTIIGALLLAGGVNRMIAYGDQCQPEMLSGAYLPCFA